MKCARCNQEIKPGEERAHLGQTLCEDCCIDALSPMKTCDPWAVHSAKTYEKHAGKSRALTPLQSQILKLLEERGAMEPRQLLVEIGQTLQLSIRHKITFTKRFAMIYICHGERIDQKTFRFFGAAA